MSGSSGVGYVCLCVTPNDGAAVEIHVERLARQAALRELLDTWDREGGPVPESEQAAARAAFDELDGLTDGRRSA